MWFWGTIIALLAIIRSSLCLEASRYMGSEWVVCTTRAPTFFNNIRTVCAIMAMEIQIYPVPLSKCIWMTKFEAAVAEWMAVLARRLSSSRTTLQKGRSLTRVTSFESHGAVWSFAGVSTPATVPVPL